MAQEILKVKRNAKYPGSQENTLLGIREIYALFELSELLPYPLSNHHKKKHSACQSNSTSNIHKHHNTTTRITTTLATSTTTEPTKLKTWHINHRNRNPLFRQTRHVTYTDNRNITSQKSAHNSLTQKHIKTRTPSANTRTP